MDKIQETVKQIVRDHGMQTLQNSKRIIAFFPDLSELEDYERKMLQSLFKCEGNAVLVDALDKNPVTRSAMIRKLVKRMEAETGLPEKLGYEICSRFYAGLDEKIPQKKNRYSSRPSAGTDSRPVQKREGVRNIALMIVSVALVIAVGALILLQKEDVPSAQTGTQPTAGAPAAPTTVVTATIGASDDAFQKAEDHCRMLEAQNDYASAVVYLRQLTDRGSVEQRYFDLLETYEKKYEKYIIGAADALLRSGRYREAAEIVTEAKDLLYCGSFDEIYERCCTGLTVTVVAAGGGQSARIHKDGSVSACGENQYDQCNTAGWRDVISVATGDYHTVGLRENGGVYAVGSNKQGQCDTGAWTDIVAVAAGDYHTIGIREDGSLVAVGRNSYGQYNVQNLGRNERYLAVAAGLEHTVALRQDGTVAAIGDNRYGQCDVSGWTDIVALCAGTYHTVGLKADGTVVAAGSKNGIDFNGQKIYGYLDVDRWTDIIAIAAGDYFTMGLKSDGTVVATGHNNHNQIGISHWADVTAIGAGGRHSVCMYADGSVGAVGANTEGQCEVRYLQ